MIATADLIDAHGDAFESCETQFRDFGGRLDFHGVLRTVGCREDSGLIRQVLSEKVTGGVLVVDGAGSLRCALFGDVMAELAVANGWSGVIFNGAVRDVVALRRLPLGVKALGSNPRRPSRAGVGQIDAPVTLGGATFRSGGYLYADEDGVLVSASPLHQAS